MAAQKGKDLLLQLDSTGSGAFVGVAGLRSARLSFNAQTADSTTAESAGRWRELLAGAGPRSASVSGSGIFKDSAADAAIRALFFSGETASWRIVIPDFGTVTGPFQLTALEYRGEHDDAASYDLALASAGALTFAAL